jgi:hypothetical protein
VFVDTRTGANPTVSTPAEDLAEVLVSGDGEFRGWLIVNGTVDWQSDAASSGLIHAHAGLAWSGRGRFAGAVIARNGGGTAPPLEIGPRASISYDCRTARTGGGTLPAGWFVRPGSYREVPD